MAHWLSITPNHEINKLIDKLPSTYDKQTSDYNNDIHTTHVTNRCLRESYFKITNPKKTNSFEAKSFIVGEAQHIVLQKLLGPLLKAEVEKRVLTEMKNGKYVGIVSRIDMLTDDAVIELKTNGSFKRSIKQYYLDQIKLYLAATNKTRAILIIIWQNAAREIVDPRLGTSIKAARMIESYDIKLTKQELADEYKKIENNFYKLTNALIASDPSKLFAIKQDVNLRKVACGYCKYKRECDEVDPVNKRVFVFRDKVSKK